MAWAAGEQVMPSASIYHVISFVTSGSVVSIVKINPVPRVVSFDQVATGAGIYSLDNSIFTNHHIPYQPIDARNAPWVHVDLLC